MSSVVQTPKAIILLPKKLTTEARWSHSRQQSHKRIPYQTRDEGVMWGRPGDNTRGGKGHKWGVRKEQRNNSKKGAVACMIRIVHRGKGTKYMEDWQIMTESICEMRTLLGRSGRN